MASPQASLTLETEEMAEGEPQLETGLGLDSPFLTPRTAKAWVRGQIDTYTVQEVRDVWVPEHLRKLFPSVIVEHVQTQFYQHEVTGSALLDMRTDEDLTSCDIDEELVRYGDRVQILSAISDCRRTQRGTWSSLTFDQKVSHPALITCAVLAMGILLVYLKFILVPLVMSVFFSYFLQPLVEILADRPLTCCGRECCVDWCGTMHGGSSAVPGRHKTVPGFRKVLVRCTGDRKTNPGRASGAARCLCKSLLLVRLPRWLAVATAYAVFILTLTGIVVLIIEAVDSMLERKEAYQDRYSELYNATRDILFEYDVDLDQVLETTGQDGGVGFVDAAFVVLTSLGGFVADLLLVLLFACYLLMEKKSFLLRARVDMEKAREQSAESPGDQSTQTTELHPRIATLAKFDDAVRTYINYKFGLSAATGFFAGSVLALCGVDLAPLFGLMAFLLNFIPIVGSVIATLIPLPIVLFQPDMTLLRGFLAIFLPGCVQGMVGNVVEPVLFGEKFDMHEVTVLASLTLWSVLWGVPGAVLSVPIMVIVLILLKTMKHPVAAFLVGVMRGKFVDDEPQLQSREQSVGGAGGNNPSPKDLSSRATLGRRSTAMDGAGAGAGGGSTGRKKINSPSVIQQSNNEDDDSEDSRQISPHGPPYPSHSTLPCHEDSEEEGPLVPTAHTDEGETAGDARP